MKLPKKLTRFCPYCKKKTEQKLSLMPTGGKRRTLARGSLERAKKRSAHPSTGSKGRWGSRPAVSKWKRKTKSTKRNVIIYTCQECKKSKQIKKSIRTGKIQLE